MVSRIPFLLARPWLRRFRHKVEGREVFFDVRDRYSFQWFYPRYAWGRSHEPALTALFCKDACGASRIFDVGANLGWFALHAAILAPHAQVWAFDLSRRHLALCRRNAELNGCTNLREYRAAIGATDGFFPWRPEVKGPSPTHRLRPAALEPGDAPAINLPAIRLDTLVGRTGIPELIKIDVEGAELQVLQGAERLLRQAELRTIYLEIHPAWIRELGGQASQIPDLLRKAGFRWELLDHRKSQAVAACSDPGWLDQGGVGDHVLVARRAP